MIQVSNPFLSLTVELHTVLVNLGGHAALLLTAALEAHLGISKTLRPAKTYYLTSAPCLALTGAKEISNNRWSAARGTGEGMWTVLASQHGFTDGTCCQTSGQGCEEPRSLLTRHCPASCPAQP